jgi:hypothetical protein
VQPFVGLSDENKEIETAIVDNWYRGAPSMQYNESVYEENKRLSFFNLSIGLL